MDQENARTVSAARDWISAVDAAVNDLVEIIKELTQERDKALARVSKLETENAELKATASEG